MCVTMPLPTTAVYWRRLGEGCTLATQGNKGVPCVPLGCVCNQWVLCQARGVGGTYNAAATKGVEDVPRMPLGCVCNQPVLCQGCGVEGTCNFVSAKGVQRRRRCVRH